MGEKQVTESSWIPKTPGKSARVEKQSICEEKPPSVPYWLNAGVISQTVQANIGNCSNLGNSVCFQREIQSKNVVDLCNPNDSVHVSFDNPGVGAAGNSSGIRNLSSFYLDMWNQALLHTTDDAVAAIAHVETGSCTSASISHVQRASSRAESSDSSSTIKGLFYDSATQFAFETYQLKVAELNAGTFHQHVPLTPNLTNTVNKAKGSYEQNYWVGEAAKENADNTLKKIPTVLRDMLKEGQSEIFVDTSCSNASKTSLENQEPDMFSGQNVDLKTPQQRPRKKKHRPKVDVEDKSKRKPRRTTPACSEKTSTPKRKYVRRNKANTGGEPPTEGRVQSDPGSEAKTTAKRKYSRKKGGNEPTMTPPKEGDNGTSSPETNKEGGNGGTSSSKTNQEGDNGTSSPETNQAVRKSCRRSLKFDSDCQVADESSSYQNVSDLGCKSTSQISLGENQAARKEDIIVERAETSVTKNLVQSMEGEFEEYLLTKGVKTVSSSTPPKFDKPGNKLMAGSPDECSTGRCQIVFSDATHDKLASILEFKTQKVKVARIPPSTSNCSSILTQETYGRRGTKRERPSSADLLDSCGIKSAGVQGNCFQEFSEIPQSKVCQKDFSHISETFKKKKSVQVHKSTISTMLPTLMPADYRAQNNTDAYAYVNNCRQTCCSGTMQVNFSTDSGPSRISAVHSAQYEQASYEYIQSLGNAGQRTKGKSKGRAHNLLSCSPPSKMLKSIPSVDAIIEQFNRLDIEAESSGYFSLEKNSMFTYPWENALVVYRDQTMIPFDALSNRIKKRPPRPKVNLDEETARVWCLLLENINSEGIDGTDDEKRKYWQQERKMFRGRINSFIAKMRLVQGDRRFRPWKGSVLDSIVGVFLTQNVSDHLSSSAFMSMAARFPLKPDSDHASAWEGIGEIHDLSHLEENTFGKVSGALRATNDRSYQDLVRNLSEVTESIGTVRSPSSDSSECGPSTFTEVRNSEFDTLNGEALMSDSDLRASDGILSSQASVISSQNSTASFGQTSNKKVSCPLSFLEESTSDYSQLPSFLELLQMQEQKVYNPGNRRDSPLMEAVTKSGISESHMESKNLVFLDGNSGYADQQGFTPSPNIRFSESFKEIEHFATDLSGLSEESAAGPSSQNSTDICFEQHMFSMGNHDSAVYSRVAGDQQTKLGSTIQYHASFSSEGILDPWGSTTVKNETISVERKVEDTITPKPKNGKNAKEPLPEVDWDMYRKQVESKGKKERTANTMDSVDWEAVRCTEVGEIAETIKERGMNNRLAQRIKDFLNRLIRDHGSIDLEWLRDIPPDKAKEYLLSVRGLGLKSVECVRLLTLHQLAFPVDTNVGRIAVRLGWVPLQPLPESLQLHLLELYPVLESIQKHLWPRLCKLDQRKLYELHYHMITFGKVFCTKSKPNCNACPMRGECRHFASAYASARLALPAPPDKSIVTALEQGTACGSPAEKLDHLQLPRPESTENFGAASVLTFSQHIVSVSTTSKPIIEEPTTPQPIIEEPKTPESEPIIEEPQLSDPETDTEADPDLTECPVDIEDYMQDDDDEIPTIDLNIEALNQNLQNIIQNSVALQNSEYSKSLVVLTPEAASIPMPKLKNINRLRTEHQVYVLPDSHQLLKGVEKREKNDQCPYLLAIWAPGETINTTQPPERRCSSSSEGSGQLCFDDTCYSCNSIREATSQTVRGTLLIPCRTAMRGSFPLNGTYFQVNEVFADHESSLNPIDVPRDWLWNLRRRTVYFGTSIPTIFKGLEPYEIQYCFWRGFVCVRGFDRASRGPRPLIARLHFPVSHAKQMAKNKGGGTAESSVAKDSSDETPAGKQAAS